MCKRQTRARDARPRRARRGGGPHEDDTKIQDPRRTSTLPLRSYSQSGHRAIIHPAEKLSAAATKVLLRHLLQTYCSYHPQSSTMALPVNAHSMWTLFFHVLPRTITIIRFLLEDLCRRMEKPVAYAKKAEGITRRESPCCRMERTPSPSAQTIDSSLASTATADDDDDLYAPLPPRTECPICLLTLPLDDAELADSPCCGKVLCAACVSERKRVIEETNRERWAKDPYDPCFLEYSCPCCRDTFGENNEEYLARLRERMERNQAYAFYFMGQNYLRGLCGLPKDDRKAFELYLRAAELGHAISCFDIAGFYFCGDIEGVDVDKEKNWDYFVLAARGGHVEARYILGKIEHYLKGNKALAYKHWRISAAVGCDKSMKRIRRGFRKGRVTVDEYEKIKQDHQKAKYEMKSEQRNEYLARLREMENMQENEKMQRCDEEHT